MTTTAAKVPDSGARAIRTTQQGGVLYGLVELLTAFGLLHLDGRQYAAVLLVGTPLVGYLQALVENRLGRAFLREVPPQPPKVPVIDGADDPP